MIKVSNNFLFLVLVPCKLVAGCCLTVIKLLSSFLPLLWQKTAQNSVSFPITSFACRDCHHNSGVASVVDIRNLRRLALGTRHPLIMWRRPMRGLGLQAIYKTLQCASQTDYLLLQITVSNSYIWYEKSDCIDLLCLVGNFYTLPPQFVTLYI